MSNFITFIFLFIPLVVFGQYDSTYCAQKYEESRTSEYFAPTNFPEIEGGFEALTNKLSYPDSLASKGIEGTVRIWFLVTPEGQPECFKIVESPNQSLSAIVVESLKTLNFHPAIVNKKPVERPLSFPILFKVPNNK